ncbi:MAG: outer membrane beta-barrel protein [Cellvibrio sp.]
MQLPSRFHRFLLILLLNFTAASACADVVITPTLGRSKIDLKSAYAIDGEEQWVDGTTTGVSAGYRFNSNILLGGNLSFTYGDNFLRADDDYHLYEGRALIGYVIPLNKHLRITPVVGISWWELDTKEGRFLNPGRERKDEFTGSDPFVELLLEFPINRLVVIHASYTQTDFDFGETRSARAGVSFQF